MKRRMVLLSTAALAGAGCSKYGDEGAPQAAATSAPPASEPASAPATTSPPSQGEVLVKAADVPVGGGTVITDKKVVVTQPEAA